MAQVRNAFLRWTPKGGQRQFLSFDVVPNETQSMTATMTERPVEKGPDVTDHVRQDLDNVKLECVISNEPLYDTGERGAVQESVPLEFKQYTPPLVPTPGALFGALGGAISRLFGSELKATAQVLTFDSDSDMVSETHDILRTLKESAQLIDLYTTTHEYHDMILLSCEYNPVGTGGTFNLNFRQIRRVEVKVVTAPIPTEIRAKKAVKKAAQGPAPAPEAIQSVTRHWLGHNPFVHIP